MKLADLKQVNQKSIRNAGPGYTPGQDADAPNLEIDALNIALEGLICSPSFRERIRTLAAEIEESFSSAAKSLHGSVHGRLRKPSALNCWVRGICISATWGGAAYSQRT